MKLIHGSGEVVAVIEELLKDAKAGKLVAIVACTVEEPNRVGNVTAYREGLPQAWARMLASFAAAQHDLIALPNE